MSFLQERQQFSQTNTLSPSSSHAEMPMQCLLRLFLLGLLLQGALPVLLLSLGQLRLRLVPVLFLLLHRGRGCYRSLQTEALYSAAFRSLKFRV